MPKNKTQMVRVIPLNCLASLDSGELCDVLKEDDDLDGEGIKEGVYLESAESRIDAEDFCTGAMISIGAEMMDSVGDD